MLSEAQKRNRRAIELVTVALLRRSRSLLLVSAAIAKSLPLAILAAHTNAAKIGRQSLRRELAAAGLPTALPSLPLHRPDRAEITALSRRYARSWLDEAQALRRDGSSFTEATRGAHEALAPRRGTLSVTETSQAFNDEREDMAAELAEAGLAIELEWVAEVTACKVCWSRDGERVDPRDGFNPAPGHVHPNCQCTSRVVLAD
jgi:hypothetical protein